MTITLPSTNDGLIHRSEALQEDSNIPTLAIAQSLATSTDILIGNTTPAGGGKFAGFPNDIETANSEALLLSYQKAAVWVGTPAHDFPERWYAHSAAVGAPSNRVNSPQGPTFWIMQPDSYTANYTDTGNLAGGGAGVVYPNWRTFNGAKIANEITSYNSVFTGSGYTGRYGADTGGGFNECGSLSKLIQGLYRVGGDTWGLRFSTSGGNEYLGAMSGLNVGSTPAPHCRATFDSNRVATAGVGLYGVGPNGSGGKLYYTLPSDPYTPHVLDATNNFSLGLGGGSGTNGTIRRPCGQLIDSWVDGSDNEYFFTLTRTGLHMYANTSGASGIAAKMAAIGAPANLLTTADLGDQIRLCFTILDSKNAIAINWDHDLSVNPQTTDVYLVTTSASNWSGATSVNTTATKKTLPGTITSSRVYEVTKGNNGLFNAACGYDGVFSVSLAGTTLVWTKISTTNDFVSSVHADSTGKIYAGQAGGTLYGNTNTGLTVGHGVLKGNAAHNSWTYPASGSAVKLTEFKTGDGTAGTGRAWWLSGQGVVLSQAAYDCSMIRVDPFDDNHIVLFGRAGCWQSRDGGTTWYPAMNGMNGGQTIAGAHTPPAAPATLIRTTGPLTLTAYNDDYLESHTLDGYKTAIKGANYSSGTGGVRLSLTASVTYTGDDGKSYKFTPPSGGNPATITKAGVPIHDARWQGMVITPVSMAVDTSGTVYILQDGGGIVVLENIGTPGGSAGPLQGAWLDTMGPGLVVGQNVPGTATKYTASTWEDDVNTAAPAVKTAVPSGMFVFGNGGDSPNLYQFADGVMYENWLRAATSAALPLGCPTDAKFTGDLDAMLTPQINSVVSQPYTKLWSSMTLAEQKAWQRFIVASYLIGNHGSLFLAFNMHGASDGSTPGASLNPWDANYILDPAFTFNFGIPLDTHGTAAAYRLQQRPVSLGWLYGRRLQNGLALVNLDANPQTWVLDRTYTELNGAAAASSYVVPGKSGVLLKTTSAPIISSDVLSVAGTGTVTIPAVRLVRLAAALAVQGTGTVTILSAGQPATLSGALDVTATGSIDISASSHISVAGSLAVSGAGAVTIPASLRVRYAGALAVAGTGTVTLIDATDIPRTTTAIAGPLVVAGTGAVAVTSMSVRRTDALSVSGAASISVNQASATQILSGVLEVEGRGRIRLAPGTRRHDYVIDIEQFVKQFFH